MNNLYNPVQDLSNALAHAQFSDAFDPIVYRDRNWENWHKLSREEKSQLVDSTIESHPELWLIKSRQPSLHDISVEAFFPQTWGSTALGFGGIGGAAITTAYTIVLKHQKQYLIYFSGTFAYSIKNPTELFFEHIAQKNIYSCADSHLYHSN